MEEHTNPERAAAFPGGTFFGIEPDGTAGLVTYPPGVVFPGYGPPNDYGTPNADGAIGGNPGLQPVRPGPMSSLRRSCSSTRTTS